MSRPLFPGQHMFDAGLIAGLERAMVSIIRARDGLNPDPSED